LSGGDVPHERKTLVPLVKCKKKKGSFQEGYSKRNGEINSPKLRVSLGPHSARVIAERLTRWGKRGATGRGFAGGKRRKTTSHQPSESMGSTM